MVIYKLEILKFMKNSIIITLFCFIMSLTYIGCEDGKDEYLSDFSTILYFRNSGEIGVTIYKIGSNADYELIINKAGSDLGATASVEVGIMSEASLTAYNSSEGVDYKLLPSTCYTLSDQKIEFGSSDLYKTVNVSLSPENIEQNLGTDGTYVIPIELYNGSDSINVEKQYAFIIPTVETLTVGFANSGYVTVDDITGDGTVSITQSIVLPVNNQWDLSCDIEVDEDVLNQYNVDNGKNIGLLAEDAYTIEVSPFNTGTNTTNVTITLDKSKMSWGLQALPLRIVNTSNSSVLVNEESSTCILGLNYTVLRSELTEIPLTLDMLSSNATVEGDGTGLTGLFDGRGSGLHWHSDYSGTILNAVYGHYIDFALPYSINHFAYNFWTRYENSNGAPVTTIIYASNDGITWKEIGEVSNAFTSGDEEYDSNVFSSGEAFAYVRFSVVESNAGNVCTGQYWNCGEVQIFGK